MIVADLGMLGFFPDRKHRARQGEEVCLYIYYDRKKPKFYSSSESRSLRLTRFGVDSEEVCTVVQDLRQWAATVIQPRHGEVSEKLKSEMGNGRPKYVWMDPHTWSTCIKGYSTDVRREGKRGNDWMVTWN